MKTGTTVAITLSILCMASMVYAQGSLTPPGAPAATMKTLEQVESRIDMATVAGDASYHHVVSASGSYYLSGNLGVTLANGIHVTAAGVTLDLNGFEISRASGSGGNGIDILVGADGTTVRNGTIAGLFDRGIKDFSSSGLYEKLAVSGCDDFGIQAGTSSVILDCRAHDNLGPGIRVGDGSTVSGCTAYNNLGPGIYTSRGAIVSDCTAYNNISPGSSGIFAGDGSTVSGCSAYKNDSRGIHVDFGSSVTGCTAYENQQHGIMSGDYCTVSGNTCFKNGLSIGGAGISGRHGGRIVENHVISNGKGIYMYGTRNTISGNTAVGNITNYVFAVGNSYGEIVDNTGNAGSAPAFSGNGAASGTISTTNNPWANFSL